MAWIGSDLIQNKFNNVRMKWDFTSFTMIGIGIGIGRIEKDKEQKFQTEMPHGPRRITIL
jgi:hypothetical protein